MIQNMLANFQKKARNEILHSIYRNNKTLVIKAPTGSGKTIILIASIDEYFNKGGEACFIWLCPGAGDLEEQSRKSMESKCPTLETRGLSDVLSSGFEKNATYFINWETITKTGNIALKEAERKNLFKRIATAHRNNLKFILVIDEEHQNDTSKAQNIIDAFSAIKEIRMSATAKRRPTCDYYEIEEQDVIDEGFISKAIVINEDLTSTSINPNDETKTLIDLALEKRSQIANEYLKFYNDGKTVEKFNPLIIIQFPSSSNKLITTVEEYLDSKGINYDNTLAAKWMAETNSKINLGQDPDWSITDNNAYPIVLLMKQAISTGWDCPRAKILVKLRDNMDEDFEIQTIGRIRRMPERKHYSNDLLDYCYLYTLDSKYVESVRQSTSNLFEIKNCTLKDEVKEFQLTKELKHNNSGTVDIRKTCEVIYKYFESKYTLKSNPTENIDILKKAGFEIGDKIIKTIKTGVFSTFNDLQEDDPLKETKMFFDVDTSGNQSLSLLNSIAHISGSCGIRSDDGSQIIKRLFRKNDFSRKKILKLPLKSFYAFVINNEELLKEDFKAAANQLAKQLLLHSTPNTQTFKIPRQEKIKYDPTERATRLMTKNVYNDYTEQMITDDLRWKSERELEYYCETNAKVKWIYKNGDSGLEYFSITYNDKFGKEWLFYPDYILSLTDNSIWIIEGKGGQNKDGSSANIDAKILNKFESFKEYANRHKEIHWGFIRVSGKHIYLSNTQWKDDMSDATVWEPIEKFF